MSQDKVAKRLVISFKTYSFDCTLKCCTLYKVSDSLLYMMLDGMEKHRNITVLDFPNNIITDESIETLVKVMAIKVTVIHISFIASILRP